MTVTGSRPRTVADDRTRRGPAGWVWPVLCTWAAAWAAANSVRIGGAWHFFAQGSALLVRGGAQGGLHLYAGHPQLQIGPLAFEVALPFTWLGPAGGRVAAGAVLAVLGPALLWLLDTISRRTGAQQSRGSHGPLLLVGLPLLAVWPQLALASAHLDDVLAVSLVVGAAALVSRRPLAAALLLGLAADAKPWAAAFVALILAARPGRRTPCLAAWLVTVLAAWLPFVLADPGTLSAAHYTIVNRPRSALRALGVTTARTPPWDRPAQVLLGTGLGLLAVARGRPWAVPVVVMAARLVLEPSTNTYYAGSFLVGAAAYELLVSRARRPVLTPAAGLVLYLLPYLTGAGLDAAVGAVRAAFLVVVLGTALLGPADGARVPGRRLNEDPPAPMLTGGTLMVRASRPERTNPMPRVLVVEDDPGILALMQSRLRHAGHLVVGAGSAEQALELLAGKGVPDVAVLDVLMPGMSGLELLALLRRDPAYADMPVVFLSGRVEPADIASGHAVGATYLTKPFVSSALLSAIDKALAPKVGAAGTW